MIVAGGGCQPPLSEWLVPERPWAGLQLVQGKRAPLLLHWPCCCLANPEQLEFKKVSVQATHMHACTCTHIVSTGAS